MTDELHIRYYWITSPDAVGRDVSWCVAHVILNGVIVESVAVDAVGELKDLDLCKRSAISRVMIEFNKTIGKDIRHEPRSQSVPDPRPDDSALPAS